MQRHVCTLQTSLSIVTTDLCSVQTSTCTLHLHVCTDDLRVCTLQTSTCNVQLARCSVQTTSCSVRTSLLVDARPVGVETAHVATHGSFDYWSDRCSTEKSDPEGGFRKETCHGKRTHLWSHQHGLDRSGRDDARERAAQADAEREARGRHGLRRHDDDDVGAAGGQPGLARHACGGARGEPAAGAPAQRAGGWQLRAQPRRRHRRAQLRGGDVRRVERDVPRARLRAAQGAAGQAGGADRGHRQARGDAGRAPHHGQASARRDPRGAAPRAGRAELRFRRRRRR